MENNMQLIDSNALMRVPNVRKVVEYDEAGYGITYHAVSVVAIKKAPVVDAVVVVRCKDCKYARELSEKESRIFVSNCMACQHISGAGISYYPEYNVTDKIVWQHDYCRYGVRKSSSEKIDGKEIEYGSD